MTGSAGLMLHLEKVLPARPERVFDAFVDPGELARWWGPEGFTTPALDLDARAGGRYRITMQPPGAEPFHLRGEFREIERPRRLEYTFEWEEPVPDDRETVVRLSFLADRRGTRIVLDHGSFATEARLALHEAGWTESLGRLERTLA